MTLLIVTAFVMLSRWQLNASLASRVEADPTKDIVRPYTDILSPHQTLSGYDVDTVVEATGTYVQGSSYLVENKMNQGEKGFWVVAEFIPEGSASVETTRIDVKDRAIAVARAWTPEANLPPEPSGKVTVAGRIVANDPPTNSDKVTKDLENIAGNDKDRVIGSAATAQLTNLWDAPLYGAVLTAAHEVPAEQNLNLTATGSIATDASIMGESDSVQPVRTAQVTQDQLNWLNIFYSVEWVIFAGFALYLWWRSLKDAVEKDQNPAQYFEYEGEYFIDQETGRAYYYDPADQKYYYFDEVEPDQSSEDTPSKPLV